MKDKFWFTKNGNGIYFHEYADSKKGLSLRSKEYVKGGTRGEVLKVINLLSYEIYFKKHKIEFDKDTTLPFDAEEKEMFVISIQRREEDAKKIKNLESELRGIYNSSKSAIQREESHKSLLKME